MIATIEDYIRLTVKDCKRLGFFTPRADTSGVVRWTQGANVVASIGFETHLSGVVPYAVLTYNYKGTPVRTELTLRFKPSNLKSETGYYYFVCPVTGLSCRNLYLVNGRFVSRTAFRPLYRIQAESHPRRGDSLHFLREIAKYEDMTTEKYRRLTYKGKPTPYGRKVTKYSERLGGMYEDLNRIIETKGWRALQ